MVLSVATYCYVIVSQMKSIGRDPNWLRISAFVHILFLRNALSFVFVLDSVHFDKVI